LFEYEKFFDSNRLTCDVCNEKTDSLMGAKIQRLPPVLNFCLLRFEFDFETMQRKKINDRFEYPLELNMAPFLDTETSLEDVDSC
jgi:ubiquitin carboxyl-terminal hydrolase 40